MWVPIGSYSFQSGYLIIIANTIILSFLNQFIIHRTHIIALLSLAAFSLLGASLTGTPLQTPISQIIGISLLSAYFLNALTTFGLSLTRWMELHLRVACALAIYALITWPVATLLTGDARLRAIYSEPSYFVFVTLPAVGYCVSCYLQNRRYGREIIIFLMSYALADSALGFLGLMLIAVISVLPRLKGRQMLLGALSIPVFLGCLYFASTNFRLRAYQTTAAIVTLDLSKTNPSTFAFLSNTYVAWQSLLAHPFTGIGIGGYSNAYDKYIGAITGITKVEDIGDQTTTALQLNRYDANSMFLRAAAELGLPGLLLLFSFLFVCGRVTGTPYRQIRNAILPYLLIRMGRGGHYFTVELYFFVGIYLLNFLESNRALIVAQRQQSTE